MKMKKLAAILLSVAMIAGMTACNGNGAAEVTTTKSGDDASTTTPSEFTEGNVTSNADGSLPSGDNPTVLKWLGYYNLEEDDALVVKMQEKYGITIENDICANGTEYFETLGTKIASDLSPDIVRYEWMSFPHGMTKNTYMPLDSYIDLDSDLWSGIKSVADSFVYNGKHYYIPHQIIQGYAIFYNRLALEENGIAEDPYELYQNSEWTWDKFKSMMEDWCDIDESYKGYNGVPAMSFIVSTGTPTIDVIDGQIINNLKNQNVQRAMEFLEELNKEKLTFGEYLSPEEAFKDGTLMFYGVGCTWAYERMEKALNRAKIEREIVFVPFPRDPQADKYYHNYDTFGYMIPTGANNIDGAVKWMTINRENETDTERLASAKETALSTDPVYAPKCAGCGHIYDTKTETEVTVCPECSKERTTTFKLVYTEEQYDLYMDLLDPEKFGLVFDDYAGFNDDLRQIFENYEDGLMNVPMCNDWGISFTTTRDQKYNAVEAILDEYRAKMTA